MAGYGVLMISANSSQAPYPSGNHRPTPRLPIIDAVRAGAILAMVAYHTSWDLGFLRLTAENYALSPFGRTAAHVIAGSFLFLVGIGLVLKNGRGIDLRSTLFRLMRIVVAAAAITGATWFAFPDSFIFFGVLHCIAAASVLGLPFLFLPIWVSAVCAALVLAAPRLVHAEILDAPALLLLGLGIHTPRTNDYVPLFPWFGLVLAGICAGRIGLPALTRSRFGHWQPHGKLARWATSAGRHSLAIYLIHQPVLLGLLTGLAMLAGPHPRAGEASFRAEYVQNCMRTGGEQRSCQIAARCTMERLRSGSLWRPDGGFTVEQRLKAQALSQACYEAAEGTRVAP